MSLYLNKNNDLFISYGNDDIIIDKSNLIKEYNSLFGSSNSYMCVTRLRQVGKSYIVSKFANEQYENAIVYDFRHNRDLRIIFEGNLDVDSIIRKSASYFLNVKFVPYKTILVFEEFLWANGLSEENIEEDIDYHLQLQLNKIFDSIPSQHAQETDTLKFKYSDEKKAVELTNLKNHLSGLKRKASIMKIKKKSCYKVSFIV